MQTFGPLTNCEVVNWKVISIYQNNDKARDPKTKQYQPSTDRCYQNITIQYSVYHALLVYCYDLQLVRYIITPNSPNQPNNLLNIKFLYFLLLLLLLFCDIHIWRRVYLTYVCTLCLCGYTITLYEYNDNMIIINKNITFFIMFINI